MGLFFLDARAPKQLRENHENSLKATLIVKGESDTILIYEVRWYFREHRCKENTDDT